MTIEPRGERFPARETTRPHITHDILDVALVTSVVDGIDVVRISKINPDDAAVLTSATSMLRRNMEAEPLLASEEDAPTRLQSTGQRVGSMLLGRSSYVLAPHDAIIGSLGHGETLAGDIAAAGQIEIRHPGQAVKGKDQKLIRVVNDIIIDAFGFGQRRHVGTEAAPLMWARSAQLLGRKIRLLEAELERARDENEAERLQLEKGRTLRLLLPIGGGLERSLTRNSHVWISYPDNVKKMGQEVTSIRNTALYAPLPERIERDIQQNVRSTEAQDKVRWAVRLDIQQRLLMSAFYSERRFIPRPRQSPD